MSGFSLKKLVKEFEGFSLGALDYEVEPGWFIGLVGPNGAGKTTLLRMLAGLSWPTYGTLEAGGLNPRIQEAAYKARVTAVFEDDDTWYSLSPRGIARHWARFYPAWDQGAFEARLERFELKPDQKLSRMSRGQRSLSLVSAALSTQPELLILDEPNAGLDPRWRRRLLDELRDFLTQPGRTVVLSTQVAADLETAADELLFLHRGRWLQAGPLAPWLAEFRQVRGEPGRLPEADGKTLWSLGDSAVAAARVVRTGPRPDWQVPAAWGPTVVEPARLEDVFTALCGHGGSN